MGDNLILNALIRLFLEGLSSLGIIWAIKKRRESSYSILLIASFIGILLSIPLVPPIDADIMRAYAATMPVLFLLPAFGIQLIIELLSMLPIVKERLVPKLQRFFTRSEPLTQRTLTIFSATLLALVVIAPFFFKVISHPPIIIEGSCPVGEESHVFRYTRGSWIQLVDNNYTSRSRVPLVRIADFRLGLMGLLQSYPDIGNQLAALQPPVSLLSMYDLKNGSQGYVALPAAPVDFTNNSVIQACGRWTKSIFIAQSFSQITNINE